MKTFIQILLLALVTKVAWADESKKKPQVRRQLTELSLEELANVEVLSTLKKPKKRSEVPAAVYVVTQEVIRRSGATSIPEALRLVPGVHVAQVDSNKWSIGIRGFGSRLSRSVLVLLDGRSVYTPLFAGVYWEVQDSLLEDVERIEVIRGPGGTIWGANAVNGVINIITKSAKETQGILLSTGGGSVEQGFGGFRYGGQIRQNGNYRLYGKLFNRDAGFHRSGTNFDDWRMGQFGFRMDWDSQRRDTMTLQGDLYSGLTGQHTVINSLSAPFATPVEKNADLSGGNILGRWRRVVNERSEAEFQFYYDRTNRRELQFRENRDTFDLDFQHRLAPSSRQEIIWGLAYRVSSGDFRGVPTIAFIPNRRTEQLFNAFTHYEVGLADDKLHLAVGSKLEHNDYSGFEAQPAARLLWAPAPRQVVWAAISRAVRTPSRIEHDVIGTSLLDAQSRSFSRIVGDKRFVSEKLLAYEAGYRIQPTEGLSLFLAGFFNDYDDLLSIEPGSLFLEDSPPRLIFPFSLLNGIQGTSQGGELAADWRLSDWWRFTGTYSFLRLDLRNDPASRDPGTARSTEGSSPRHQVSVQSFMNLPRKVELDFLFRFVDELPSQRVGSYVTADLRLGWRPTEHLELSLAGRNLFQSHHAEFGGGPAGITEVKRSAYGKITWRW